MADKIIVLCTNWEEDYWERPREAPYKKRKYTELPDWERLAQNCPLPGLGIYIKQYEHKNFVYLRIDGMRFDLNNQQPLFGYEPIKVSSHSSEVFLKLFREQFPDETTKLFLALEADNVLKILQDIGEKPPEKWIKLVKKPQAYISWRDYVGKRFLDLIDEDLGNNEFEDKCYELLRAIGFKVEQRGHILKGEYPDGEIDMDDILIVYECKNIRNFAPGADDERKLKAYVDYARVQYGKGKNIYGVFIVKSSVETKRSNFLFWPVDSLVYILYKKIKLGKEFDLSPIRVILKKGYSLNKTLIDNEWRE